MPKALRSTVAALGLLSLFSCMHKQPVQQHQTVDLVPLEKKITETNEKLEKLHHRVSILQLMVDTQQRAIQDMKSAGPDSEAGTAATPPAPGAITEEILTEPNETVTAPPQSVPPLTPDAASPEPRMAVGKQPPAPAPKRSPDAEALYGKAYKTYQAGKYRAAADLFDTFAARYPHQDLADNALYWAGECRYATKDFTGAVRSFKSVLKSYPNGNKVPDALLKIGFSYLSLGDRDNAVGFLKKAIKNYPFSPAASKAETKLKQLKIK